MTADGPKCDPGRLFGPSAGVGQPVGCEDRRHCRAAAWSRLPGAAAEARNGPGHRPPPRPDRRVALHSPGRIRGRPPAPDAGESMDGCRSRLWASGCAVSSICSRALGHPRRAPRNGRHHRPGRRGGAGTGIDAHRHGSLMSSDRSSHRGVPCTTVARTLLDLAAVVPIGELQRAIAEAEVLGLFDIAQMRRLIRRARGRRGVARLRMLVDGLDRGDQAHAQRARATLPIPLPASGAARAGGERTARPRRCSHPPGLSLRDARLIVETDGRLYHDTRSAFEADRRRAQRLQLAGSRVAPCTWSQVVQEPRALATVIREPPISTPRRWAD